MTRVWQKKYTNVGEFYTSAYGTSDVSLAPLASQGAQILRARQGAGDWSGAPLPDLTLTHMGSSRPPSTLDIGAGRFRTDFHGRAMLLESPNIAPSIYIEEPHEIEMLAVNYASLRELCTEVALPADGDFGALHCRELRHDQLYAVMQSLSTEAAAGNPHGRLYSDGALMMLATMLLGLSLRQIPKPNGGLAGWQLRRTTEYLDARLAEPVSLAELAAIARLSPFHFTRAFRASTGHPPHRYHMHLRVERAKEMLQATDMAVTEIALSLGFDSSQTLARVFRKCVGCTPSEWRRDRLG